MRRKPAVLVSSTRRFARFPTEEVHDRALQRRVTRRKERMRPPVLPRTSMDVDTPAAGPVATAKVSGLAASTSNTRSRSSRVLADRSNKQDGRGATTRTPQQGLAGNSRGKKRTTRRSNTSIRDQGQAATLAATATAVPVVKRRRGIHSIMVLVRKQQNKEAIELA